MINFFIKNKKGVTILEGLIALGLLAAVSVGIFGVLLSLSRKSYEPDIREEMLLAVERAQGAFQLLADIGYGYYTNWSPEDLPKWGMCGTVGGTGGGMVEDYKPMDTDVDHDIKCMLPAICDPAKSSFTYRPFTRIWTSRDGEELHGLRPQDSLLRTASHYDHLEVYVYGATFKITCNGFTL